MVEALRIRPLTEEDLPMILAWRNASSVREFMFHSHKIGLAEHRAWFERMHTDPARRLLIVESDAGPLGFVQFSGVEPGGVADWGFYARPDAAKGTGRALGAVALDHAFSELRLHKVSGQALAQNVASIRLHQRLGFDEEGRLRDHHRANGSYHSVVLFGLLGADWPAARAAIPRKTYTGPGGPQP